ncbi:hypothetical protein LINPERHAP2_LOCUS9625 [Linum perenne]
MTSSIDNFRSSAVEVVGSWGTDDKGRLKQLLWRITIAKIWRERCNRIFGTQKHNDEGEIRSSIDSEIQSYMDGRPKLQSIDIGI